MIVFKRIWGEIYYRLYYFLIKEMADDGDEGADTHTHTHTHTLSLSLSLSLSLPLSPSLFNLSTALHSSKIL